MYQTAKIVVDVHGISTNFPHFPHYMQITPLPSFEPSPSQEYSDFDYVRQVAGLRCTLWVPIVIY